MSCRCDRIPSLRPLRHVSRTTPAAWCRLGANPLTACAIIDKRAGFGWRFIQTHSVYNNILLIVVWSNPYASRSRKVR
jgi:hypothetical protein